MEENSSTSEEYEIIESGTSSSPPSILSALMEDPLNVSGSFSISSDRCEGSLRSEPKLNIANNGNIQDLENELNEVMKEKTSSISSDSDRSNEGLKDPPEGAFEVKLSREDEEGKKGSSSLDQPFLDAPLLGGSRSSDYTIFNQILYLGAAAITCPRAEAEIHRNMAILNSQCHAEPIRVSVSIPFNSDGLVVIYDAQTKSEIVEFHIRNIIFCAKGEPQSTEAHCFAFTSSHGTSEESAIFQCHVFRCQIAEAVSRVLATFVNAFHRVPQRQIDRLRSVTDSVDPEGDLREHRFDISVEIKEEDGKGNFNIVPRDKECFKLRSNVEKQITFTVLPLTSEEERFNRSSPPADQPLLPPMPPPPMVIERCFGVLIAHGRKVKHADMNLLEMVSMGSNSTPGDVKRGFVICAFWDPKDPSYFILNKETPKDMRVFMTVAIDLVIRGIQEPVRFAVETKVKVFPQTERFWYYSKRSLTHLFSLKLKRQAKATGTPPPTQCDSSPQFVVVSVDNLGEVERGGRPSTLSLNLASLTSSTFSSLSGMTAVGTPSAVAPCGDTLPINEQEESDDDEPLLSGSGEVSKDCPEQELELWRPVILKWQANAGHPAPKEVVRLVRRGVPEALRGEVWQLLSGAYDQIDEMMDTFRILMAKDCPCEQVILRDINRTFPAHDFFKESGGVGQDALYKVSRAYSVYDEEVSYCQGISFLSAALVLHMPEEQSFCVLVQIMFKFGLRNLFKDDFEVLHLRLYQLDRLMEEHVCDLWSHFQALGIESHMFASQWFLTLYTAKFPLVLVFPYLDLFLLLGMDTVFQVAIALLQTSRWELMNADFEGVLKFFRVTLPKKFRTEEAVRTLMRQALRVKVKKLQKYERDYVAIKERDALQTDPREKLERENRQLLREKLRLDRENDFLANEFASTKITLKQNIDQLEERVATLAQDLASMESELREAEEEKKRLTVETTQVKDMLKKEVERCDAESVQNAAIIADYKDICSRLSHRLAKEQSDNATALRTIKAKVSNCPDCSVEVARSCDQTDAAAAAAEGDARTTHPAPPTEEVFKDLEVELAATKLRLVESECQNQDLTHQLNSALNEVQAARNTWFQKTLSSFSSSLKDRPPHPPAVPSPSSSAPPIKEEDRTTT